MTASAKVCLLGRVGGNDPKEPPASLNTAVVISGNGHLDFLAVPLMTTITPPYNIVPRLVSLRPSAISYASTPCLLSLPCAHSFIGIDSCLLPCYHRGDAGEQVNAEQTQMKEASTTYSSTTLRSTTTTWPRTLTKRDGNHHYVEPSLSSEEPWHFVATMREQCLLSLRCSSSYDLFRSHWSASSGFFCISSSCVSVCPASLSMGALNMDGSERNDFRRTPLYGYASVLDLFYCTSVTDRHSALFIRRHGIRPGSRMHQTSLRTISSVAVKGRCFHRYGRSLIPPSPSRHSSVGFGGLPRIVAGAF